MGGAGNLFIAEGLQVLDTTQFPQEYKRVASEARDYLNSLQEEKELDYSKDGSRTKGAYRFIVQ